MAQDKTPLELAVETALDKIRAIVKNLKDTRADLSTDNQDYSIVTNDFSDQIKKAIQDTLNALPNGVGIDPVYRKIFLAVHPDKPALQARTFGKETLEYLNQSGLLDILQKSIGTFKNYIPEKPPSVWENPIRNSIEISMMLEKVKALQNAKDLFRKQEANEWLNPFEAIELEQHNQRGLDAEQVRDALKISKKNLKEIAPISAFTLSLERGLGKYPQPLKFIINFLFSVGISFPLSIAKNVTLLVSFIIQNLSHYLLQAPLNAILNLLTSDKFNVLLKEDLERETDGLLELIIKQAKKEDPENTKDFTLQVMKDFLSNPFPNNLPKNDEVEQARKSHWVMNLLLTLMLSQEAQRPTRVITLTLAAAWKSLTEKGNDDSDIFFFFSCLLRLPFLIIASLITIALQTCRFILEMTVSALTTAIEAVGVASLFVLNLPRLIFKLPKYLSKAWDNRAELASSFGNWLSEKAFTLASGLLLSLSAVGVAAAVFGLDPMMLGIVAGVSGALSLILTHDDLDVGNRGFKFGLSLMIFLGAAVMVFFAFGPTLFPSIAEFIPSLPHLLDYLLPFAEPIQAAIAAACAVAIVLLPTIIAGTMGKVVDASSTTSTVPDEPKQGGSGGLGWDPDWQVKEAAAAKTGAPNPGLGEASAHTPSPTGPRVTGMKVETTINTGNAGEVTGFTDKVSCTQQ